MGEKTNIKIANIQELPDLISEVKILGDANSSTLGFLPDGAFDEIANKGKILVAYDANTLAGYLLFRDVIRSNQTAVVHLCVKSTYRGKGVASKLVEGLKEYSLGRNGIFLWCRKDYQISALWEKLGFTVRAEKPGRSRSGSTLEYWLYVDSESAVQINLFDLQLESTCAVLDANTFFDLVSDDDLSSDSKALQADWLQGIQFQVTPELFNEIRRDSDSNRRNKSRNLANSFGEVSANKEKFSKIKSDLDSLIGTSSSIQLESDKLQLAWAIASGAEYFVTRDTKLLGFSIRVREFFGLEIVRATSLIVEIDSKINRENYQPFKLLNSSIELIKVGKEQYETLIESFLYKDKGEKKHLFQKQIDEAIGDLTNANAFIVRIDDKPTAFYVLKSMSSTIQEVPILRIRLDSFSSTIANAICTKIIKDGINTGKIYSRITEQNIRAPIADALFDLGFVEKNKCWQKYHVAKLIDISNHEGYEDVLEVARDLGVETEASPYELEKIFWPLKLVCDSTKNYIIPIEPYWAKELFDTSYAEGDMFGSNPFLIHGNNNIYYRSGSKSGLKDQSRILWYVKRNPKFYQSGAIRAMSLLDGFEIGEPKEIYKVYQRYGVYKWDELSRIVAGEYSKNIMAIRFSCSEMLPNPIPYEDVNDILFENGRKRNNFQSPLCVGNKILKSLYIKGRDSPN